MCICAGVLLAHVSDKQELGTIVWPVLALITVACFRACVLWTWYFIELHVWESLGSTLGNSDHFWVFFVLVFSRNSVYFSSVHSLSHAWLFLTPWTAAHQASLSIPEFIQTHVCWVDDAIQPSHPLSSPSAPTFSLSQDQSLFKWVSSSHQVARVLEFQLQHQSFQWIFRTDLL